MRRVLPLIALVLVLAPAAGAGVSSPQSGWYAGNPILGPNNLERLACAGSTCYASGAFGTVLKTGDGGANWSGSVTGVTTDLPRIGIAGGDPDRVLAAGTCTLLRSDDGARTFRRLPVAPSNTECAPIAAFAFPTSQTGYVLREDGDVLVTSDGGNTFTPRTSIVGASDHAGSFAEDIWCTGEQTCFTVTAGGSIERTDNGAGSWTLVAKSPRGLAAVRFADANTGWAVGASNAILKTTDGGATWQDKSASNVPGANLTGVSCAPGNPELCLFSTLNGNQVIRTTDGGESYSSIVTSTDATYAAEFSSPTRAIAAGATGSAEVSDDGGAGWAPVGTRVDGQFSLLRAVSPTTAFAAGMPGLIARTTDSGQSWSAITAPTSAPVNDIASPDNGATIFELDTLGVLSRSSDGGATWQTLPTSGRPANDVIALSARRILLIKTLGIALSTNGGASFKPVRVKLVKGDSLLYADRAPGAIVVYGRFGLLESTDAGATWRHMRLPHITRRESLRYADFVTPRVGYVTTTAARLFKTRDAGHHWSEILSKGGGGLAIAFSDARHGYVVTPGFAARYNGVILRTSDGGATWRPQIVAPGFLLAVASAGSTDYALSPGYSLFATRTGGDAGAPSRLTFQPSNHRVTRGKLVTLNGRLTPARDGAEVVVSVRSRGRWITRVVPVASNGVWTFRQKLQRTTGFIAQAFGDATHAGAGTHYVVVRVRG